jgi:hypothetical protein
MDARRLTGKDAGSLKYDLLTALSVLGLYSGARSQISISRMVLLITARYNWRLDEFTVGQRDLARMWNVTDRTVKREIKYWLERKMVICKRQGVRGRVGAYRLNYPEIYRLSEPYWSCVGPDFDERMQSSHPAKTAKVVAIDFLARGRLEESNVRGAEPENGRDTNTWRATCSRIKELHPARFESWIATLSFLGDDKHVVRLEAPTRFAARYIETHLQPILLEAIEATLGPGRRISLSVRS